MTQSVITEPRPSHASLARSSSGAALAGVAFAVEGVIAAVHTTGDHHWDGLSQVLNAAFIVACLALVVALPAVGAMIASGRVARVGTVGAQIGYAAMAVESIVSGIHGGNTLGPVFVLGLGLSLLGLLTLAAPVLYKWRAGAGEMERGDEPPSRP